MRTYRIHKPKETVIRISHDRHTLVSAHNDRIYIYIYRLPPRHVSALVNNHFVSLSSLRWDLYASEVNRIDEMPQNLPKSDEKSTLFQFNFFYAHQNHAWWWITSNAHSFLYMTSAYCIKRVDRFTHWHEKQLAKKNENKFDTWETQSSPHRRSRVVRSASITWNVPCCGTELNPYAKWTITTLNNTRNGNQINRSWSSN